MVLLQRVLLKRTSAKTLRLPLNILPQMTNAFSLKSHRTTLMPSMTSLSPFCLLRSTWTPSNTVTLSTQSKWQWLQPSSTSASSATAWGVQSESTLTLVNNTRARDSLEPTGSLTSFTRPK